MNTKYKNNLQISIIGLGYVGLPLALALARVFSVTGYDSDTERVNELTLFEDRTGEVSSHDLKNTNITFVNNLAEAPRCDLFIIAVPTPIDKNKEPDLHALEVASREVGEYLTPGAVVVYESTVFPGVTEDICGPILESASGLACGEDFFLGYSPERINPGDREHGIEMVTKVVSGQTSQVTELLSFVYGAVITAGVYEAPDIRTAEAAKVIENAQRDINIAFINEITMIFHRLGIDTENVLSTARSKWNFLDFRPGLVGGHCIGVDPYYLAHAAEKADFKPKIILAGRRINDGMARYVGEEVNRLLSPPSRILIMGLTFKENVRDLRNSQIFEMVRVLIDKGHSVDIFDPMVSASDVKLAYGLDLVLSLKSLEKFDALIVAVGHDAFRKMSEEKVRSLVKSDGLVVDLKRIWPNLEDDNTLRVWHL